MKVYIIPNLFKGKPYVYADMYNAEVGIDQNRLIVSATIDYCIDAAKERGYEIINAEDVLNWLQNNSSFKPY